MTENKTTANEQKKRTKKTYTNTLVSNELVRYSKDVDYIFSSDPVSVFLVHRRVMTDLFKTYGLRGYEIETLLFIASECKYDLDTVVSGQDIRNRISKRFSNVLRPIVNKLIYEGYIENLQPNEHKARFKLKLLDAGIMFCNAFKDSINKHLSTDKIALILNSRFSWEKIPKDKD